MKIFSAILMLLILAMNFKACADELFVSKSNIVNTIVEKAKDHSHNEKDDCSPFCYCACCSVRSFSATEINVTFFSPQNGIQNPVFF